MSYSQVAGAELAFIYFLVVLISCHREYQVQTAPDDRDGDQKRKKPAPAHRYHDYEHSSDDEHRTAEQQSWAFTKYINIFVACIAVVAAFFAGWTWWETRNQAITAAGQLAFAKSQEIKQLRAYIGIDPTQVDDFIIGDKPVVKLQATNYGQTPALDEDTRMHTYVLPYNKDRPLNLPTPLLTPNAVSTISDIFQGHPITVFMYPEQVLTAEDYRKVIYKRTERFVIVGVIRQKDVFGGEETRSFRFSYYSKDDSTNLDQYEYCPGRYNTASYLPPPNAP